MWVAANLRVRATRFITTPRFSSPAERLVTRRTPTLATAVEPSAYSSVLLGVGRRQRARSLKAQQQQ